MCLLAQCFTALQGSAVRLPMTGRYLGQLTCSNVRGLPGVPRTSSFSSFIVSGVSSHFLPDPHTRAGRGLQSGGISGISNLRRSEFPNSIPSTECRAHHFSAGTPKGSSSNPGRTGRPSCHRLVSRSERDRSDAEVYDGTADREGPPMTTGSSSSSPAKANAREELEGPGAEYGSSSSSPIST